MLGKTETECVRNLGDEEGIGAQEGGSYRTETIV